MTGLPEYNLPAFAAAEEALNVAGYEAVNPGRRGVIEGYKWSDYMRDAIGELVKCDGLCLLPGWEKSRGAAMEYDIAVQLGITIGDLDYWLDPRV
jgi:hypothetical protein